MAMREDDRCRQRAIGGELAQQVSIAPCQASKSSRCFGTRRTGCALSPVTRQRRSGISSSTPSLMSSFTRPQTDESSIFVRALISLRVKSNPGHQPRKSTIFCCCAGSLPLSRTLSYAISDESETSVFMREETPRPPPPGTPRQRSSSAFASRDRRSWLGFLLLVMKSLERFREPRALADLAALPRCRLQLPGGNLLPLRHAQLTMQRPRLLDRPGNPVLRFACHLDLLSKLARLSPSPPSQARSADSKESATQVSRPPSISPNPSPDHSRDCAAPPPTSHPPLPTQLSYQATRNRTATSASDETDTPPPAQASHMPDTSPPAPANPPSPTDVKRHP